MSDNKLAAIVVCAFMSVMVCVIIFGNDSDKAKEKTKQLEIQYKIDSLKSCTKKL